MSFISHHILSSPPYSQAPRRHPIYPSNARQHHDAVHLSSDGLGVLDRLSSLFRRDNYNAQHAPPRTRLLEHVPNLFSLTPRDEGVELQEHHPTVVDVPLAEGRPVSPPLFPSRIFDSSNTIQRNYTARELFMKRKKEKEKEKEKAMAAKKASSGNSHP